MSTTEDGRTSRIRPLLREGEECRSRAPTSITWSPNSASPTRSASRYGNGPSALIDLAHPDYRADLLRQAKALGYVPIDQTLATCAYPLEDERKVRLKNGSEVMLRPARSTDADGIRTLFHQLSPDDVYTPFFPSCPRVVEQRSAAPVQPRLREGSGFRRRHRGTAKTRVAWPSRQSFRPIWPSRPSWFRRPGRGRASGPRCRNAWSSMRASGDCVASSPRCCRKCPHGGPGSCLQREHHCREGRRNSTSRCCSEAGGAGAPRACHVRRLHASGGNLGQCPLGWLRPPPMMARGAGSVQECDVVSHRCRMDGVGRPDGSRVWSVPGSWPAGRPRKVHRLDSAAWGTPWRAGRIRGRATAT